jgi:hypothetical protein
MKEIMGKSKDFHSAKDPAKRIRQVTEWKKIFTKELLSLMGMVHTVVMPAERD